MPDVRELLELLKLEDIKSPSGAEIAQLIGMAAFRELVFHYGGCNLYIPEAEKLILPVRNEMILREFNGNNRTQLARKWGISERHMRNLTKEKMTELKAEAISGQTSFF